MQVTHSQKEIPKLGPAKVHLLKSKWYAEDVDRLAEKFLDVMKQAGTDVTVHTLSGSLEMALAIQDVIEADPATEAVVCLGVIMKGETAHFEMMLDTLSAAFVKVSLEKKVPIINGIIPAFTLSQVTTRTGNDDKNKGIEAALATIETILWRRNLRA